MVYLIYCDHKAAQTIKEGEELSAAHKEFVETLRTAIIDHSPTLIAEEHNCETLTQQNRCSLAKIVATAFQIRHRFCEPDFSERHRETFKRRLKGMGIYVRVIAKGLGAAPLSSVQFSAYREVRRRGFPPEVGCFCSSPRPKTPIIQSWVREDLAGRSEG